MLFPRSESQASMSHIRRNYVVDICNSLCKANKESGNGTQVPLCSGCFLRYKNSQCPGLRFGCASLPCRAPITLGSGESKDRWNADWGVDSLQGQLTEASSMAL